VIALELLPAVAADDPTVVDTIVDVVNRAYMTAETELWRRPLPRTDSEQTLRAIVSGEVAVARLDGAIVGSLLVSRTQAGAAKRKILASSAADVQTEPNAYTVSPPLVTAAV
jgi:predicted FMN-binding regulatory protein PaiB